PAPDAAPDDSPSGPPAPEQAAAPVQVAAAPPTNGTAVWVSRSALQSRPVSGRHWSDLLATADGAFGTAKISSQDSNHDMRTLAAALVWARTGIASYRAKAAGAINRAIGTEAGGRTLALARNLTGYVVAADLIDLKAYDPAAEQRFRPWLSKVRTENLGGMTLISTHESRSNNWGAMAGVSRIAADLYLGDVGDLNRAATVFRGYTGDRDAYAGFEFGDMSWQADPSAPVPIDAPGASKAGLSIDGALPDDMRRGCAFRVPPCQTWYPWEAMQGIIMQADLLSHHGFPAFAWSENAVYRAARFLRDLDGLYGGWWVTGDDIWQPSVLNHAYGPVFPSDGTGAGKVFGWTDWVYGT
ncbi:MAG: alginate lyase family protein, partial [Actinomycetota bacterium]|nr:alginate lyase family protein [Actinomycetota bacterium]